MAVSQHNPVVLSEANRQVLETWRVEFERSWDEGRLAAWARQLPPSESPLRLAA